MDLELGIKITESTYFDSQKLEELHEYFGEHINYIYETGLEFVPYRYFKGYVIWDIHFLDVAILKGNNALERLEGYQSHIQSILDKRDYKQLFLTIDRKIALDAYVDLFNQIPDEDKYAIFRSIYINKEYNFEDISVEFFETILVYRKHCKEWNEDMKLLKSKFKEDVITIYRGEGTESTMTDFAFSWSISKDVARFFARRFSGGGFVMKGKIRVEEVCDYITIKDEKEILVIPGSVQDVEEIEIYE